MTLFEAIHALARAHTRDDARCGFTILSMGDVGNYFSAVGTSEYIEAWKVIRHEVGLSYEAEESCPGHVASKGNSKICGRCGVHVDSFRPDEHDEVEQL